MTALELHRPHNAPAAERCVRRSKKGKVML